MNGLEARYATLSELRTKLRRRLGFVTTGPAASLNTGIMDDFLQEGHDLLYEELKMSPARKKTVITLAAGQYLYDWHNDTDDEDIDPGNVKKVWIAVGDTIVEELVQGITERMRAFDSYRTYPSRYDTLNGQIELYPIPDAAYGLTVEYLAPKARFTQDSDRPSVPDRLILLYAIANAKAHYRHPDATAAGTTYAKLLALTKSKQHENRRYVMRSGAEVPEQVVATADGYKLRVR